MKNIVFDLGGVLFARDKSKCTPELLEFFSFLRAPRMPLFWEEYDRGTSTLEEVTATIPWRPVPPSFGWPSTCRNP